MEKLKKKIQNKLRNYIDVKISKSFKDNKGNLYYEVFFKNNISKFIFEILHKPKIYLYQFHNDKYIKTKYDLVVESTETSIQKDLLSWVKYKYHKIYSYRPSNQIIDIVRHNKNSDVLTEVDFLFFKYIKSIRELLPSFQYNPELFSKKHIGEIKDLIKRMDNVYKNNKSKIKNVFTNDEFINLFDKYDDVDTDLTRKLASMGINYKHMIYCAYNNSYNIMDNKGKIHSPFLLYPAILVKDFKKHENTPNNINEGYILKTNQFNFKKIFKFVDLFKYDVERGYIATNGSFYNRNEAAEIAYKSGQIKQEQEILMNNDDVKFLNL